MDDVVNDCEAVIITRNRNQSVVMISLEEYEALEETSYLLRSPKNATRLIESINELNNGKGSEKQLVE